MKPPMKPPMKPQATKPEPVEGDDAPPMERTQARRSLCTLLKFWRICGRAGCRRARACAGDPDACFERHWPAVSEPFKVLWRAAIQARAGGRDVKTAIEIGVAARKRWDELAAEASRRKTALALPATKLPAAVARIRRF